MAALDHDLSRSRAQRPPTEVGTGPKGTPDELHPLQGVSQGGELLHVGFRRSGIAAPRRRTERTGKVAHGVGEGIPRGRGLDLGRLAPVAALDRVARGWPPARRAPRSGGRPSPAPPRRPRAERRRRARAAGTHTPCSPWRAAGCRRRCRPSRSPPSAGWSPPNPSGADAREDVRGHVQCVRQRLRRIGVRAGTMARAELRPEVRRGFSRRRPA